MSTTVQIRDLDDEVYASLRRHASAAGLSVPEYLRKELGRIAARPTMREWLARTERRSSTLTTEQIVATLDELRGPWPDDRP